ncbi:S26 family signal peptidase [Natronomonas sp. LN261]|uniref:S26 family signal peptidase n=1 Tax=Natronomonas sp. LN261 TaxID=2750669 RepID=UPI0015EF0D91|nr:S26 family signal peptidase [Natronomonas sp. LN261]
MTDRTDDRRHNGSSDTSPETLSDASSEGPSEASSQTPHGTSSGGRSTEHTGDGDESPEGVVGWLRWFWTGEAGSLVYLRDVLTSVLIVVAIGILLFAISGVWPPMVAVESGSMEPNMERGDLVFIVDNGRFVPDGAVESTGGSTGVVPASVAEERGRTTFGRHGDVIVFRPNGNAGQTPIIHRAMLWVEGGENWYDRADPDAVGGADNCETLEHCPAPHAGFITKGDNELTNANYDQASRLSAPVRPAWIVGTAELRVPYLGHVRLLFSGATVMPTDTAVGSEPGQQRTGTSVDGASERAVRDATPSASVSGRASLQPA